MPNFNIYRPLCWETRQIQARLETKASLSQCTEDIALREIIFDQENQMSMRVFVNCSDPSSIPLKDSPVSAREVTSKITGARDVLKNSRLRESRGRNNMIVSPNLQQPYNTKLLAWSKRRAKTPYWKRSSQRSIQLETGSSHSR